MIKTAIHPTNGLTITFTEETHTYLDQHNFQYTSGTTFLKHYFPPFDINAVSAKVAAKEGKTPEQVKAEWTELSESGTRLHENAENQFMNQPEKFHQPKNNLEYIAFNCAYNTVKSLQQQYELIGCELIVFSKSYRIAGQMDLLMYDRNRNVFLLLDWKKCKTINKKGWDDAKACFPVDHIPDCNFSKYSLQLSLYQRLMRDEGYIQRDAKVEQYLIHIPPMSSEPVYIPAPYLVSEIAEILIDNAYNLPF